MRDEKGRFIKGHKQSNTGKTHFKKGIETWSKGVSAKDDERIKRFCDAGHKKSKTLRGSSRYNWKGEDVGYRVLHLWVNRELGKPKHCEECDTDESKRFVWHNIDGRYKRNLNDWVALCSKCHINLHRKGIVA